MAPFKLKTPSSLIEEDRTETRIVANQFCGDSTLTISIEEPESGELWLRFQYQVSDVPSSPGGSEVSSHDVDEIRKQAYRAADIDTVRMIREPGHGHARATTRQSERPLAREARSLQCAGSHVNLARTVAAAAIRQHRFFCCVQNSLEILKQHF